MGDINCMDKSKKEENEGSEMTKESEEVVILDKVRYRKVQGGVHLNRGKEAGLESGELGYIKSKTMNQFMTQLLGIVL